MGRRVKEKDLTVARGRGGLRLNAAVPLHMTQGSMGLEGAGDTVPDGVQTCALGQVPMQLEQGVSSTGRLADDRACEVGERCRAAHTMA